MALGTSVRLLSHLPLFEGVSLDALRLIAFGSDERRLRDGQVLFSPGDVAHSAYLIQGGEVDLYARDIDSHLAAPQRLSAGAMLGTMSLFIRKERDAKAVAVGDIQVLSIPKRTMERVLQEHPEDAVKFDAYFRRNLARFAAEVGSMGKR